jgi:PDZ domain
VAPAEEEVTLTAASPAATATPPAAGLSAAPAAPAVASAATPTPAAAVPGAGVATTAPAAAASAKVGPAVATAASSTATPGGAASAGDAAVPAGHSGEVAAAAVPAAAVDAAAVNQSQSSEAVPAGTTIIPSAGDPTQDFQNSQVLNYQANQQMPLNEPQLHSLQEFMNEGVNTSPLGVELQEGARRAKNGREVDGLLVVALQPGSPAERAGVQAGHREAHDVLEGAAVAASLVFPPAVLAVPVIETMQFGENYDLIIGIDGNRVTNFMDFQDQLRDALPGETVYLNILRAGKRLQVPVEMPSPSADKVNP